MQARKAKWAWALTSTKGRCSGEVMAVDPRDAVSRALTSETAAGKLVGEAYSIPVDVLNEVPANFSPRYEVLGTGFRLCVEQEAA